MYSTTIEFNKIKKISTGYKTKLQDKFHKYEKQKPNTYTKKDHSKKINAKLRNEGNINKGTIAKHKQRSNKTNNTTTSMRRNERNNKIIKNIDNNNNVIIAVIVTILNIKIL